MLVLKYTMDQVGMHNTRVYTLPGWLLNIGNIKDIGTEKLFEEDH
jgi:hypothetical protein